MKIQQYQFHQKPLLPINLSFNLYTRDMIPVTFWPLITNFTIITPPEHHCHIGTHIVFQQGSSGKRSKLPTLCFSKVMNRHHNSIGMHVCCTFCVTYSILSFDHSAVSGTSFLFLRRPTFLSLHLVTLTTYLVLQQICYNHQLIQWLCKHVS